jgi:hypothetical protein
MSFWRCWPCLYGYCPGGGHSWADDDDLRQTAEDGGPDPRGQLCGCSCAHGPSLDAEPEPDESSLDAEPCPVCGELTACAWDSEGRALIHAWVGE